MDLARVRKKMEEAQFSLGKMTEQERQISGDKQPFDYYLSAFLNAARTIDYRLRHEQGATYRPWRDAWDTRLTLEQRSLMKFIADDRADEVHESGSRREVGQEGVKFGIGEHRLPDGSTLTVAGVPAPLSGILPAVVAYKPTYSYTIDGAERKVTEACTVWDCRGRWWPSLRPATHSPFVTPFGAPAPGCTTSACAMRSMPSIRSAA
jgi:hypothetical protein